jgi:chorismate dehydratase
VEEPTKSAVLSMNTPTQSVENVVIRKRALDSKMPFVRVGAVSYLNSKPLIFDLADSLGGEGSLSLALPSRLADDLNSSTIDVGLIPVIEYFPHPQYKVVSNAVIACRGPVWSVRVFFRGEPRHVQTLALDVGSRTSAALIQVLFQSRFGFVPTCIPLDMSEDPRTSRADAVLVIGDRAMHPECFRDQFPLDWDLGQAWWEETRLPFVFAMWVARNERFANEELKSILERSRDFGQASVAEIAASLAPNYRLTPVQCQDYLTNYIRFHLGAEEQAGLDEFQSRCHAMGLI